MELSKVSLGDVADVTKLAGFEFTKHVQYVSDGEIIAIRGLNVKNGILDLSDIKRISKSASDQLPRSKIYKNNIIITYTGTIGEVALVTEDDKFHLAPNVAVVRPRDIHPYYLYCYMRSSLFRSDFEKFAVGSTQQTVPMKNIRQIEIPTPSQHHQVEVGRIISLFDDKIELNQKMNQTLEDIAKAIFKSWFVDFDPVRAKAEGRPTGLPADISDLFPDGLVDSENGEIPTGWEVLRVRDFADAVLGGTPSRKNPDFWGGDIPWINSGAVNEFRILEPSELITQQGFKKSSTKLLPEKSTVIAITGATLGQVSYLEIETCANQSVVGVIAHSDCAHEWVYLMFVAHIERLINRQTGGAQQHINKNDVLDFDVIYPTEKLISSFSEIASPLFKRIGVAVRENLVLSQLRDTLLPKLISGELRIPDAEKFLEEAGI